jgi:hypothetical protein
MWSASRCWRKPALACGGAVRDEPVDPRDPAHDRKRPTTSLTHSGLPARGGGEPAQPSSGSPASRFRRPASLRCPPYIDHAGGEIDLKTYRSPHAACLHVGQLQSEQAQFAQVSLHDAHSHALWLQVEQVQFAQSHVAQASAQFEH